MPGARSTRIMGRGNMPTALSTYTTSRPTSAIEPIQIAARLSVSAISITFVVNTYSHIFLHNPFAAKRMDMCQPSGTANFSRLDSTALFRPEVCQPSGTANFSRLDSTVLRLFIFEDEPATAAASAMPEPDLEAGVEYEPDSSKPVHETSTVC